MDPANVAVSLQLHNQSRTFFVEPIKKNKIKTDSSKLSLFLFSKNPHQTMFLVWQITSIKSPRLDMTWRSKKRSPIKIRS